MKKLSRFSVKGLKTMKISGWMKRSAKQVMIWAIASCGFWNIAIASAEAQAGNVIVYMSGNNPVTLDVARQVVTNPVVALVNGQTSIVAGAFDPQTADFVTRELQRRGLDAQQTLQIANVTTPSVTLPTYLPSDTSPINITNSAQYRFVTAIPMSTGGVGALIQVQRFIPNAFVAKSFRGDYIYAGGYPNRDAAESLKHFLRSQGLDARVLYF
jgi:hypothetical protein